MKKILLFLGAISLVGIVAIQAQAMSWHSYDGQEYMFVATDTGTTWTQASLAAQAVDPGNSYLTRINSSAEDSFIISTFGGEIDHLLYDNPLYYGGLWIGGLYDGAKWIWEDGEEIPVPNSAFLTPEPNGQEYLSIIQKVGSTEGTNGNGIGWADITNDGVVSSRFGYGMSGYVVERTAPVPEPATMLLFGTGLAGLIGSRIRRKK